MAGTVVPHKFRKPILYLKFRTYSDRGTSGELNEEYCKWCYIGGNFMYHSMEEVAEHFHGEHTVEEARKNYRDRLSKLDHWREK